MDEYRTYQASHQYAVTDPNNPNLSADIRAKIQDPRVQAAIQQRQTTVIQVGDSKVHVDQGQVTGWETGGKWKPIALALGTAATGGILGAAIGGGTGASAAGATALGPSTPASLAATEAVVGGSTVPASLAALTPAELAAAGGAAGAGAATGAGLASSTPAAALPSTAFGPAGMTGPVAGLAPSGAVPAAMAPRSVGSVLGGIGSFLSSPGGATALQVGGGLLGAGIAASGVSKAAEIEAAVQREALAYEKQRDQYLQNLEAQRYGELNTRLQPYIAQGANASDRMAHLLGLPPSGPAPVSPPVPGAIPTAGPYDQRGPATPGSVPSGTAIPRGTPATVLLRAPDGSTQAVPADQQAHYMSRGAVPVNG